MGDRPLTPLGEAKIRMCAVHASATAERWVGGFGEGAPTVHEVRAALRTGEDPTGVLARAVNELKSFAAHPTVMTRAAARWTKEDGEYAQLVLRILAKAGADLDGATAWWQANQPKGWNPPQAEPSWPHPG